VLTKQNAAWAALGVNIFGSKFSPADLVQDSDELFVVAYPSFNPRCGCQGGPADGAARLATVDASSMGLGLAGRPSAGRRPGRRPPPSAPVLPPWQGGAVGDVQALPGGRRAQEQVRAEGGGQGGEGGGGAPPPAPRAAAPVKNF
jgi:hypothetical protein